MNYQVSAAACRSILLTLALSVAWPLLAVAHGDLHEQIQKLDEQISNNPRSAFLYLMRGELHHIHEDWAKALADFDKVSELNPNLVEVNLLRGQTLYGAGRYQPAMTALDAFLKSKPNDADGLLTRARVLVKLGHPLNAVPDFTQAIKNSPQPGPELYIERAQALVAAGPDHLDEAVRSLDEGIEKLGAVATLQLLAIDLELQRKQYDAALARLEKISAQSERKDGWLLRRGEILVQAGRNDDARQAFHAALAAIEALPEHVRTAPSTTLLERRARAALQQVSAGSKKP